MRESMARLTPQFSADRAVREYTEQRYLPAAAAYRLRESNKGEFGKQMADWQRRLQEKWAEVHFGEVKVETGAGQHIFEVQVFTEHLDPASVRVELYANGINDAAPALQQMTRARQLPGTAGGYAYTAQVSSGRPSGDYTARVIPCFPNVAVPLESPQVLWQR